VEEGIDDQLAGAVVGHFSSAFDAVDGRGGNGGSDGEVGGEEGEEAAHAGRIIVELIHTPFERVHVETRGNLRRA